MIELSADALSVLTRSFHYHLAVESWYGEELVAESVPVDSATEEGDRKVSVPERVTLRIPRLYRGESWSPVHVDSPLAANGQRLRVQLGIGVAGQVEWFQRGWFLIQDSKAEGDTVNVQAVGLLAMVNEARLVSPYQPTGTFASTLRGLVEPALTVEIDTGLSDRNVPASINFDEDRLDAVYQLLDAWPAEAEVTAEGYLYVHVPVTTVPAPVLTLTNGVGGTVIQATGESTRENAFNVVVARGTDANGAQIQGVAYDANPGPKQYGGPFNPLPVPFFFPSPLLTTLEQCRLAAQTVLARKKRETALQFTAEIVPHPGLQLGDAVTITTDDYTNLLCTVEGFSLPWTADGGSQRLTLRGTA